MKYNQKSLLIGIIIIFYYSTLFGQQGQMFTIKGKIIDSYGFPLPSALVTIDFLGLKTVSNTNGEYEFKQIPNGTYQISGEMTGFLKHTILVTLEYESLNDIDLILKEDVYTLNEVTIKIESAKTKIEKEAKAVQVIETKEAKQKSADLGELIAQSEGVNVRRSGGLGSNMRFALNGLTDDQIRFFVDDIPLEFSAYSLGLANIPVNLIERIEIYKGVMPIEFGADALGGGVNVVSNVLKKGVKTDISYQIGSFNTHRTTISNSYLKNDFFVQSNLFYDYSENNYLVDVKIPNQLGKLEEVTVPRFHDDYKAFGGNIKLGIQNKKIIDELSMSIFHNNLHNQIQHNNVMSGAPYGHVYQRKEGTGVNLKANLKLKDNVVIKNLLGYNKVEREFADTSSWVYNWRGEQVVRRINSSLAEVANSNKSNQFIWDNNYYYRHLGEYTINNKYNLSWSIAPNYTVRSGDELYSGTWDPLTTENKLLTWVNSINFNWKNKYFENNTFIKHYHQNGNALEPLPANLGTKLVERSVNHYGAGNVLSLRIKNNFYLKPSYEYAIRLPRPDEIYGDGSFITDNLEIQAEKSHNTNLQAIYNIEKKNNDWHISGNLFSRVVNDLILLIPNNDRSNVYENVFKANSFGAEIGIKLSTLDNTLDIGANTTIQQFYNNSQEGVFKSFYGDRIPNRPYFFANSSVNYKIKNLLKKQNQFNIYWQSRYIHDYFLTWESLGTFDSKAIISSQFLQNTGFFLSNYIANKILNIGLEIQNITNVKAFDFFGVQRPGRAYYLKTSINF